MKEIRIGIVAEGTMSIDQLHNFQGDLKKMSDPARNKLRRSILEEGFVMPVVYWSNDGVNYILDGHQRVSVLQSLKKEGYEVPDIPAYQIKARNYNHAKKLLASLISQYGKIDKEGFKDFFSEVDFDLGDFEFPELDLKFLDEKADNKNEEENKYVDDEEYLIVIKAANEAEQQDIFENCQQLGYECKIL